MASISTTPGAGLHDREDPAAHLVVDLAAEQRGAGQERHAGAGADQQRADDRHGQVDGDREHHHRRAPASTMLMPNQRRRDSRARSSGRAPMPIARPTKSAPKSR